MYNALRDDKTKSQFKQNKINRSRVSSFWTLTRLNSIFFLTIIGRHLFRSNNVGSNGSKFVAIKTLNDNDMVSHFVF